jgi:hypothetical protein
MSGARTACPSFVWPHRVSKYAGLVATARRGQFLFDAHRWRAAEVMLKRLLCTAVETFRERSESGAWAIRHKLHFTLKNRLFSAASVAFQGLTIGLVRCVHVRSSIGGPSANVPALKPVLASSPS